VSPTVALARDLIRLPSVTPEDAGCQALVAERLAAAGFRVEALPFGAVCNLWARHGEAGPLLVLAGHTDVVPPGPERLWASPPFEPALRDGRLYGRGAADMKGSVAAMVTACERFVAARPAHRGSLAVLLTSDEEGPAVDGTARVVEQLLARGERIDWCLVGEPSSSERLGDVIKHGRRGSLSGRLTVHGVQGHVAYPRAAENPIHRFAPVLARLTAERWDPPGAAHGGHFPATTFQVANLNAGTGAGNVIPALLEACFNFRYSTASDPAELRARVESLLAEAGLRYEVEWSHGARPFLTARGALVDAVVAAVAEVAGVAPRLSTEGGTSDGRFIAPTGAEVVELGPVNRSIHQVDEHVLAADLDLLAACYERVLATLLRD